MCWLKRSDNVEYGVNELEVEDRLISVLGEGHNQWTYRPDLKSEQDLWDNLRQKISQNNVAELQDVPLTDGEFDRLKLELLNKTRTPFDAAKWLKGENGIARINIDRDNDLGNVSLILFTKDYTGGLSSYEVVHQIATQPSEVGGRNRRFDVTLLINGLPIVQIELKQVAAKDGIFQAFNQIKKYAEEGLFRNNIFSTLQLFVVSNETTTRYFANALPKDLHEKFMFSWRTKDNQKVDNIYEFSKQMLNIPDAHKLIVDYMIVSEDQDSKVLMVLHPYQIHAFEAVFKSAVRHESGYIWHATGSGKTITSFVTTKLLAKKTGIDRTIMLVDRTDLDNQTTTEFTKFASEFNTGISSGKAKSNALIVGTESSYDLSKELLSGENNNTIIITTRQKLEAALRLAEKQEQQKGSQKFAKLKGQHIVFVVDECHRAISSEGMEHIKEYFPNSTWFGFTGTPIFEVNKKQAKGQLARTTDDQYGKCLHTYTIKNALEDKSVLGFQVEHGDTIDQDSLHAHIFSQLKNKEEKNVKDEEALSKMIDEMDGLKKETYIKPSSYETDEHIDEVIKKIFKPNDAYIKFDFRNGRPQKSAILTTSSIDMAKRYYHKIKELTSQEGWMSEMFGEQCLRQGRTMEDPDFPRIAITYSVEENTVDATDNQKEMSAIIDDYNSYYGTSWDIAEIKRYNGDINNRLARKKGQFKEFGNHLDLVIVVDRLLTGFDAPTIQTLYVDRTLSYANLIQAFSRTNRTFPDKKKGLIVTFRYPHTMEKNVEEATKLYSHEQEKTELVYPTYDESKARFNESYKELEEILTKHVEGIDENSDIEDRINYVKNYQAFNNAFEALITYDEYNDELTESGMKYDSTLQEKVGLLEEQLGHYETVKGSLVEETVDPPSGLLSDIEFFSDYGSKLYDIDTAYINKLLGTYAAHRTDIREEFEEALSKMNKSDAVKAIYHQMLNDVDSGKISPDEDLFSVKREYFTKERNHLIEEFSKEWCVSSDELKTSAMQYEIGMKEIPNLKKVFKSRDLDTFKQNYPDIKPFKYNGLLKKAWMEILDNRILPLSEELR